MLNLLNRNLKFEHMNYMNQYMIIFIYLHQQQNYVCIVRDFNSSFMYSRFLYTLDSDVRLHRILPFLEWVPQHQGLILIVLQFGNTENNIWTQLTENNSENNYSVFIHLIPPTPLIKDVSDVWHVYTTPTCDYRCHFSVMCGICISIL
jgi:hypothetical protein